MVGLRLAMMLPLRTLRHGRLEPNPYALTPVTSVAEITQLDKVYASGPNLRSAGYTSGTSSLVSHPPPTEDSIIT